MENKLKAKKDLYLSIALVGISFAILLGASIAWFAMNEEVKGSDMNLDPITFLPNLVIGEDGSTYEQDHILLTKQQGEGSKDYFLKPSTHNFEGSGVSTASAVTGLIYITNPKTVSPSTGYASEGALKYQPVPNYEGGRRYYLPFQAYISSEQADMVVDALNASLVYAPDEDLNLADLDDGASYIKAASVDFYIDEIKYENYIGKLSLAGTLEGSPYPSSLNLLKDGGTIPKDGSVHIWMVFYFDGALKDFSKTGQDVAYVHSQSLDVKGFHIGVRLDAVESDSTAD